MTRAISDIKLGIAIVNYCTPDLVIDCLKSLEAEAQKFSSCLVYVVDNCSPDNSSAQIKSFIKDAGFETWVTFINADKNGGFAYGNNLAIKPLLESGCDYIWLLNPDTVIFDSAATKLVEFLQSNPLAGIAGSKQVNAQGEKLTSAFNYPSILGELLTSAKLGILDRLLPNKVVPVHQPKNCHQYDWVSGASLMAKRAVFDVVEKMDDDYFLYYEEVDFCFQAKERGFASYYVDESVIKHFVGASTGITNKVKPVPIYWFNSRRRFLIKSYGRLGAIGADLLHIVGLGIYTFKGLLKKEQAKLPPKYVSSFLSHSSFVKGIE